MNKKRNLFVFLDTNIHLHFHSFDEIDWTKVFGVSKINIVFTHTILKELEKKKIDRITKLVGKRAEKAIKRIAKLIEEETVEIRKSVFVDFLAEPISRGWFEEHNLNESIGDDCLLAEMLFFRQGNRDVEVLLVTDDLALNIRAKKYFSINTFTLSEEFRLPLEVDEDKKKN